LREYQVFWQDFKDCVIKAARKRETCTDDGARVELLGPNDEILFSAPSEFAIIKETK